MTDKAHPYRKNKIGFQNPQDQKASISERNPMPGNITEAAIMTEAPHTDQNNILFFELRTLQFFHKINFPFKSTEQVDLHALRLKHLQTRINIAVA